MVYKLVPNAPPEIFARETTFTTNSVTIRQPGQPQTQSVLGKRTTISRDDIEEQERKRHKKMMEASHFLHEMKDKVRNGNSLSYDEHEKILEALILIPTEEHYRWANVLESLRLYTEEQKKDKKFWESVDGGSTRKGYKGSKRRKSKKRKSKRRNSKSKRKSKRRKSNNSI